MSTTPQQPGPALADLDDATLGRLVREAAAAFSREEPDEASQISASAMLLAARADQNNSLRTVMTIRGFQQDGVDRGDWEIAVTRLTPVEEILATNDQALVIVHQEAFGGSVNLAVAKNRETGGFVAALAGVKGSEYRDLKTARHAALDMFLAHCVGLVAKAKAALG